MKSEEDIYRYFAGSKRKVGMVFRFLAGALSLACAAMVASVSYQLYASDKLQQCIDLNVGKTLLTFVLGVAFAWIFGGTAIKGTPPKIGW